MADFYGTVQGQRGKATRLGHHSIEAVAASWEGAVEVVMSERDGETWVEINKRPWHGRGAHAAIYSGPLELLKGHAA